MKTAIVTGGAGFIGSHLCKELLKNGKKVICIDNLYTGFKKNIRDLEKNPNFKFVQLDIINKINLKCDEIYNFACPASPPQYQKDPIQTLNTSVLGIINMLELAKKNKSKILHASTSEVYGDPIEHPQKESYWGNVNPIGPRACYDEGKRIAETYCIEYKRKYKIDVKIIRIFNTYGPNMSKDDGRVVSNFITQALQNKPITLYGDGKQTRSFCYISDLIKGIILMMEKENFIGPINLGNPNEMEVKELAKKITKLTESSSKIIKKKLPENDPKIRNPDIRLAKKMLGWKPQISLEKGLKNTIDYFENELSQVKKK